MADPTDQAKLKLDLKDERLWRDGRPVAMGNRAFQLLRLLVDNPDLLLTKDQILDAIWGDIHVTEGMVKEYVHDLRLALGDDPKCPTFIETVRGRGYRFLGGIDVSDMGAATKESEERQRASLAVLALDNLSNDRDEEYFADGLSEEIIAALSFIPWIFIVSRNSSFRFKGLNADPRDIGKDLGVSYVLEGSVRRAGGRIRVMGRLIDTANAEQIWTRRYESRIADVFNMQDEIAFDVATAIGSRIQIAEIARATRKRPQDMSAYDLYLRARAELNRVNVSAATELLDAAIAKEPNYAKAKAVRAWCTTLIGWRFIAPTERQRANALKLAEEALASPDPDAETRAYAAYTIGFLTSESHRSLSILKSVTHECPSFAWGWASQALLESYHGNPHRAIKCAETSLRLSPGDPQSFRCEMAIGKALLTLRDFEKCLQVAERGLEKKPNNTYLQMCRIVSLVSLGRTREARRRAADFVVENPDFSLGRWRRLTANWQAWGQTAPVLDAAMRSVGIPI